MRDRFGLIPPHIRARHEKAEWVERATTSGRALERLIQDRYGKHMSVVFVREGVDPDTLPDDCVPGRWHVRVKPKDAPLAVPAYHAILAPGGGYRDPDSGVLDELAEMDLSRPEVMRALLDRSRANSEKRQRDKDLRTEQRRDELRSSFKAAKRTSEGGLKRHFKGRERGKGIVVPKKELIVP